MTGLGLGVFADVETTVHRSFWGGTDTTSYKILLLIHLAAVIAAFGPLFVGRVCNTAALKRTGEEAKAFASLPLAIVNRMSIPAFVVAIIAGMALVNDSGKLYKFEQTWVSLAFSLILVIALVYWFLFRPAQRRLVTVIEADNLEQQARHGALRSAKAASAAATGLIHLSMVGLIIVMIWKPGF